MIYRLVLALRHLFYDKGWKKSFSTDVPSVCIGNVTVGGTGKTPMVELALRTLLEDQGESDPAILEEGFVGGLFDAPRIAPAVLSRGYGRSTRGFLEVREDGRASDFGDEPLQIKRNFPSVVVAVDENRVEGCARLSSSCDIIILDDAFQHRRIKADKNIVLTTYSRPYFKDKLMPLGRLRDLGSRAAKADMIIVTKCPSYLDEEERAQWAASIGISSFDPVSCKGVRQDGKEQFLLFATMQYNPLVPVFEDAANPRYVHSKMAIAFSAIADDRAFLAHLREQHNIVSDIKFADHHAFTAADLGGIAAGPRHSARPY